MYFAIKKHTTGKAMIRHISPKLKPDHNICKKLKQELQKKYNKGTFARLLSNQLLIKAFFSMRGALESFFNLIVNS